MPVDFYLVAQTQGLVVGGFGGAEFRVTGLPAEYMVTVTPTPYANVVLGNPMGAGCNIAVGSCDHSQSVILLYTVTLINLGDAIGNRTLRIEHHTTPSNPLFSCPQIALCNTPVFGRICVAGGEAFLNSSQNCDVGVDRASWSRMKALYH